MRRLAFLAWAVVAACGDEPVVRPAPGSPEPAPPAAANAPRPASVEGWNAAGPAYPLLGASLPGFKAERLGGGVATEGDLRNRWTILGLWSASGEGAREEMTYIAALSSAADQDPDLDFLSIYVPRDPAFDIVAWSTSANAWPTVIGDAAIADTLGVEKEPAYLLIGPDLTIEAYRGALSKTPEDGVKPVIRGVAEIKKQIAAPQ